MERWLQLEWSLKEHYTGPPSARLKEVNTQQDGEMDADTNVSAEEEQPEPARRERSERPQSKRPWRYGDFVSR